MRPFLSFCLLAWLPTCCTANRFFLNQNQSQATWHYCLEIFGGRSWPQKFASESPLPPEITLQFKAPATGLEGDPIVSVAIFHETDGDLGGLEFNGKMQYVCSHEAIGAGLCTDEEYGSFLGRMNEASFPILTQAVHLAQSSDPIVFPVRHSGKYCVEALSYTADEFEAWVRFETRHGKLPAIQFGKLQFSTFLMFGGLAAGTASTSSYFFFSSYSSSSARGAMKCPHTLLAVALTWLVASQTLISWANLVYLNRHGYEDQCRALRALSIFLVASRNAATFLGCSYAVAALCRRNSDSGSNSNSSHQAPRSPPTTKKGTAMLNTPRLTTHLATATLIFVISAARENELLRARDEDRDSLALLWTMVAAVLMLTYHALLLGRVSWLLLLLRRRRRRSNTSGSSTFTSSSTTDIDTDTDAGNDIQHHHQQRQRQRQRQSQDIHVRARATRTSVLVAWCALLALVAYILCLGILDAVVFLSWSRSSRRSSSSGTASTTTNARDAYGRDMLSRLWRTRWFLLDEWQTVVYIADAGLAAVVWSLPSISSSLSSSSSSAAAEAVVVEEEQQQQQQSSRTSSSTGTETGFVDV
ncbi:MAG: hypothetical protein M1819_003472 [Sarea resinae]|nr:MAG: hypothetical protein M1819_003472 [Sarea resinae]